MPLFDVTFDDVGFTNNSDIFNELSKGELEQVNANAKSFGFFSEVVLHVVRAVVSEDDGQGDSDIKVFISVTLRVAAETEEDAENFEPPEELLSLVAEAVAPDAERDNNWEVLEVESAEV